MSKKTLYIYVATAGIGRMGFGAWLAGEKIDRSDGDDAGTFGHLSNALEHAGRRIEWQLLQAPWKADKLEWNTPKSIAKEQGRDVHVVTLTFDGFSFLARWLEDDEAPPEDGRGDTPSEALRLLGEHREAKLAHHAWVMEQPSR